MINWGALLILLAFVALLLSTLAFFMAARGHQRFQAIARKSYHYFTVFTVVSSIVLFYLFLSQNYAYKYVFEYSSSELPFFYLLAAFWGGQEGTYLLWLLCLALMGYFIFRYGRQYTNWALFFYGLIGLFFGLILNVLSPFAKLPMVQPDGAGLNPLLQDPWMVVHPPVIFLGYAVVAIPCAVALAALVRKDFRDWIKVAFAPTIFGAVALGAGNIMGGFWAYKTLGWGGYWAWDPVENSSLIPWLTGLALIHGLIIERTGGGLRKTNLFLAIVTFLLVIYGTFLTRSGVLADFSVHSFVDLGTNIYLIGFMIGFSLLSLSIFLINLKSINAPPVSMGLVSQEFSLLVAVWLLSLIAVIVLVGTSWPLITTFLGIPGTVETSVYTRLSFPIAVVIALFVGIAPFMLWRGEQAKKLIFRIVPVFLLSLLVIALAIIAGVADYTYLIFIFAASLAFLGNAQALLKNLSARLHLAGPQIAHIGLSLMLIGILGSSAYSVNEEVVIDRGSAGTAYDLGISYNGTVGDITTPNNEILLTVVDGNNKYEARPKLYWSQKMQGFMKKPFIKRHLFYDLYFAPEQIQELGSAKGVEIKRGEEFSLENYIIRFERFEQPDRTTGSHTAFGAVLEFRSDNSTDTIVPAVAFDSQNRLIHIDDTLVHNDDFLSVRLEKIFADKGAILLSVEGLTPQSPPDRLILEVSRKPVMNLLWGGAFLLVLGSIISFGRRYKSCGSKT